MKHATQEPQLQLAEGVTSPVVASAIHSRSTFRGKLMSYLIDHPTILLAVSLVLFWVSEQLGARVRRWRHPDALEDGEDYSLALGATLTLLGLLIGFGFSMAVGRYDQRKNYEEEEANAIGTEYVRLDFLPAADADKARALLRQYLHLRIEYYRRIGAGQVAKNNAATADLQSRLWAAIIPATNAQPDQVRALVASGMNDVLNRQGYTQAAFLNRIPIAAWTLMCVIAIFCNFLLGYRTVGKARASFLILPIGLSISFFLLSDLDSPRRGVIMVEPQNLEILADSLN
jgi:hypothetical protein